MQAMRENNWVKILFRRRATGGKEGCFGIILHILMVWKSDDDSGDDLMFDAPFAGLPVGRSGGTPAGFFAYGRTPARN